MDWLPTRRGKQVICVLLLVAALASLTAGIRAATVRSTDFQWSGASMLAHRIDPWQEEIKGDPQHRILLQQHPNYLPLLYVLFVPFGLMPMPLAQVLWLLCNLAFLLLSCRAAARFFQLSRMQSIVLFSLICIATPTRTSLGNGQQSLLVLAMLSLSLLTHRLTASRSALAGVSYAKFNFLPPVFVYLLIRSGIRNALVSLLPALVALLAVWLWLVPQGGAASLFTLAMEPLHATARGFYPYAAGSNLMDVLDIFFTRTGIGRHLCDIVETAIAVVFTSVLFWRARGGSDQWNVALLGLIAFSFYRHHNYDGVTILFPLAFLLPHRRQKGALTVLGIFAVVFCLRRIIDAIHPYLPYIPVLEFLALTWALWLLWKMREPAETAVAA